MMDFLVIVLDDRFCPSGYGDGAKLHTAGERGGTDGKVYVSIGDSNVDSGGYNGFLDRSFNRRFEGTDNWYCSGETICRKKASIYPVCHFLIQTEKLQVDHPFVPIIYFVNFVANLHDSVKMPTSRFHSHDPTMNHVILFYGTVLTYNF
ncbi:hypothetical protein BCR42DRAFT_497128 [Absidia repens]|uniref:Uncharacterized protein n=1 Tax=Absidia repens TaxID=90262 RepID=A0A1X2HWZ6_9FUNG|nr:hypothetical protein BCR42DRAFT_497128 [Absidia repens]